MKITFLRHMKCIIWDELFRNKKGLGDRLRHAAISLKGSKIVLLPFETGRREYVETRSGQAIPIASHKAWQQALLQPSSCLIPARGDLFRKSVFKSARNTPPREALAGRRVHKQWRGTERSSCMKVRTGFETCC